jgi:hypothetical protein
VKFHRRRARAGALAIAATLVLGSGTAALADDHEGDEEDGGPEPTEASIECDAELLDEEEGFPYYLVAAGDLVTCVAEGLDPELPASWAVEVFGITAEDDFDLDDPEGDYLDTFFGDDETVDPDGTLTFDFQLPDDILLGDFEGAVWQGEEGDPSYLVEFAGAIFGDFTSELMTCEPEPAVQGGEVECSAEEMSEGEFAWEVYYLSLSDFLDMWMSDDDLDLSPDDAGSGEAGDDGVGSYAFTVPAEGDLDVYLTLVEQDDYVGFYLGEIVPGEAEPVDEEPEQEDEGGGAGPAPVTVRQPTRVDAGAGGAATGGSTPLALVGLVSVLGLALTSGVRRRVTSRR